MFCVEEHKWGYFTRVYIGALIPRVYIIYKCAGDASSPGGDASPRRHCQVGGSMPQLGNKKMYCICLSRHRALTSKCRRGDASPPGEDALPAGKGTLSAGEGTLSTGEDALHAHPYIYHYILFRISDRFLCPSCSIQGKRYG